MAIPLHSVAHTIRKPTGALLLGGVILWHVALHSERPECRAIVHITTFPADVAVDEARYRVESLDQTPIVCELRPGRHVARMMRDGRALYQEEFQVAAAEEIILTAWDKYTDGRSPSRSEHGSSSDGPPRAGGLDGPAEDGLAAPVRSGENRRGRVRQGGEGYLGDSEPVPFFSGL